MSSLLAAWGKSLLAGLVSLLVGVGTATLPSPALADTVPLDPAAPTTPTTVSADPLPTVQINGVAWAQVVVGSTQSLDVATGFEGGIAVVILAIYLDRFTSGISQLSGRGGRRKKRRRPDEQLTPEEMELETATEKSQRAPVGAA